MNIRPYFLIFKTTLAQEMSYRLNYFFGYILHITQLLIFLAVWSLLFTQQREVGNYTWTDMATYYALSMIILPVYFPSHMFELQPLIRKGTLSSLLLKPIRLEAQIIAKFSATKLPVCITLSALTLLVFYVVGIDLKLSITPLAIVFLLFSFFLVLSFGLCMSTLAFWLVEMWPLNRSFQGFMALLGGGIAPLDLLPDYIQICARFTPFPYLGYLPVKALQGLIPAHELQVHIVTAAVWAGLFAFGFKLLWKLGLKRYEAVNI